MSDNKIDSFEELLSRVTHITEVGKALSRQIGGHPPQRMPGRTPEEIRQELLRLHSRWKKQKVAFKVEETNMEE
jgi:hypothetical protein